MDKIDSMRFFELKKKFRKSWLLIYSLISDFWENNMIDFFNLNGKNYPYKYIYFREDDCYYIVATEELNAALISDDGLYVSEEAKYIDEQVFFFLDEVDFYKPEYEIEKTIGEIIWFNISFFRVLKV